MVNQKFLEKAYSPSTKDMTGQKFGMLTVIEQHGFKKPNKRGQRYALWYCKCDCGNYCEKSTDVLRRKRNNHSCGCLAKEHLKKITAGNMTHGMTNTRLYNCYKGMIARCYREKDIHYPAYGGRGIVVCEEWKNDKKAFFDWSLSHGYQDDLTIERVNVDGNYEPSNCTWIPMGEQYNNKRQNIMIDWMGERHNATYWARKTGIPAGTIRWRYKHGWDTERIFSTLPEPYQEDKA